MPDVQVIADKTTEVLEILEKTLGVDIESPDVDLLEAGILDSLGLIEVMSELESASGAGICFDSLEPDDLRTARSLAAFVVGESTTRAPASASFKLPGGGEIRPLDRERIPAVAKLLLKNSKLGEAEHERFAAILTEYFFDHPQADPEIPSLIAVDANGKVMGFIGSGVRRFDYKGLPVRMGCSGPLIVDPEAPTIGLGFFLMEQYLAGPQDFSISDSATDTALMMWLKLGGKQADEVRDRWTVVLRPLTFLNVFFLAKRGLGPKTRALASLADRALSPALRLLLPARPSLVAESLTPTALREAIAGLPPASELRPNYDDDFLDWQFKIMERVNPGELRSALFRGSDGAITGWYVYLFERGGISQVLQLAGDEAVLPEVFAHLLHDANDHGGAVVDGRVEHGIRSVVSHRFVKLRPSTSHPLRHTNRADLAEILFGSSVFLSRMDGESWTGSFGQAAVVKSMN